MEWISMGTIHNHLVVKADVVMPVTTERLYQPD